MARKKKTTKEAVIETIKEGFRIAFFAALAALVAWGTQHFTKLDPGSIQVVVGTIVLRLLDKYIHENSKIDFTGISPV